MDLEVDNASGHASHIGAGYVQEILGLACQEETEAWNGRLTLHRAAGRAGQRSLIP